MINVIKNSKYLFLLCLLMVSSLTYAQGSRYTGTYKKSEPLVYKYQKNIVIEGLEFSSANERAITLWGCENVIIKNCKFKDVNMKMAIYSEKGSNILVTDCSFENVHGAFVAEAGSGNIKFEHNDIKNVLGTLRGGSARSQAVQYRRTKGAGNSISYNVIENIEGKSAPDDNINLYQSHGTPESPIRVTNNWIRGGGPSLSGGGIMLADYGGSYQIAENNIVVNPGQYGMAIAGGQNITIRRNKIYSKRRPVTNVGLYANNWTSSSSGKSNNITIEYNDINWTHRDGYTHISWFGDNMKPIKNLSTNKYNSSLNESVLPDIIFNRARNTEENNAEEERPTPPESKPESKITQVYINSFNKIAIKYFTSSTPHAYGELFSSNGQLIKSMVLPRFNTSFPDSQLLPRGVYSVRITYKDLGKTETTKVTIK